MNRFYPLGAQKILAASIDFSTHPIKAALVSGSYIYSDAHEFYLDVSTVVLGAPVTLANKTITAGVFDADDAPFGAISAGGVAQGVVLYRDTGNVATSPLICYLDEVTGFPFTTNGSDVNVTWSNGSAKIISLL